MTYDDSLADRWKYEVAVTVSASLVDGSADFTDMPYYIALSAMPQHFWDNVKADGSDIRAWTAAYPAGTEIPRHVIYINKVGQIGTLFVKRTIDDAAATMIYIRYGNPNATTPSVSDGNGQYAVWSATTHAWPLDSVGATHVRMNAAGGVAFTYSAGVFRYSSAKLEKPGLYRDSVNTATATLVGDAALNMPENGTFMMWARIGRFDAGSASNKRYIWAGTQIATGNDRWDMRLRHTTDRLVTIVQTTTSNGTTSTGQQLSASDNNNWVHWCFAKTGTTWKKYKNASSVSLSDAVSHATVSTTSAFQIGKESYDTAFDIFLWFPSELSAQHIAALYRNQNAPNTYHTVSHARVIHRIQQIIN